MKKSTKIWVVLGILSFFLLNYPLLQIFNREILLGGTPILTLYLFGVWILDIAVLYIFGRGLRSEVQPAQEKSEL